MISESFKVVIRITNKFLLIGQKKTQRLVLLLYQTTIVICNVYLTIHQFSAVDLALDFISTCDANNKFIIFSDSLSVLKTMNHTSSKNPQIQKLLEKCHELLANKEIVLCWISSHIGIQGNEMVDQQAKSSLSLEPTSFKIPFSNFKPSINKYIFEEWQTSLNNSIENKLLDIKPTIGEHQSVVRTIRKEEVVLARLRLGHTRVTHSYLLLGEDHCWLRCTIHCTSLPFGVWRFCTSKK